MPGEFATLQDVNALGAKVNEILIEDAGCRATRQSVEAAHAKEIGEVKENVDNIYKKLDEQTSTINSIDRKQDAMMSKISGVGIAIGAVVTVVQIVISVIK